ncbi:hypothetical protein ACFWAZ_01535 [Streptomyces collinus]|uniref:hypothetical protein n=1 Tax=Streptomyces collinus TaxID=42684 RepID=UPI00364ACC17
MRRIAVRLLLAALTAFATCLASAPARAAVPDSPAVTYTNADRGCHWEYLLNVRAVSTATDRADATFYTQ